MIPFEKAFDIVMNSSFSSGNEEIPFTKSLNRILAADVVSDMDMPPFNKASMDGFACRKSDISGDLEIIETIAAGKWPEKKVGRGQCSRIMTGAAVPDGADCVIMVEETEILEPGRLRFTEISTKENIAFKGEDIRKGDVVIKAPKQITPQDIAVMATVGHTAVTVGRMPRIAVISSGDEIVEPDQIPGISQIRNCNSYQLIAQAERAGVPARYYGIVRDDVEETYSVISDAIKENELVLISGGVSMGDFDFVPSVLERAGVKILFSRVAVQPGRPTTFGVHPKALVFGLPGNPVSSFVQFELLVRPLIYRMMGLNWEPLTISVLLKGRYSRKSSDRMGLIPVHITPDGFAEVVEFHGSAHISAMPGASGIVAISRGVNTIEKGEIVKVRQI
ncbi:MAG: gephyrin-like molybdotransferase Glp [Bacteroidota bacterium]